MADWNPETYQRFSDLRLRPALDLMTSLPALPEGAVIDLGCGAGAVAPDLVARFAGRRLIGVDSSTSMLEKAAERALYDNLIQQDISRWQTKTSVALIFSNAVLHWLPDHHDLLPRLAENLTNGGVLAVQVPHQNDAPSHRTWRRLAAEMFPDHVGPDQGPGVLTPQEYFDILSPLGAVSIWETEYLQLLLPVTIGHPVRHFTEATFARPILNALNVDQQAVLIARYEAAMEHAYPLRPNGSVLFAFRRLFFTLTV